MDTPVGSSVGAATAGLDISVGVIMAALSTVGAVFSTGVSVGLSGTLTTGVSVGGSISPVVEIGVTNGVGVFGAMAVRSTGVGTIASPAF